MPAGPCSEPRAQCEEHKCAWQVLAPLTVLLGLPVLRVVDLRGLHEEPALGYWSEAKCTSMRYVASFTKALRRRPYPTRVLWAN